MRAFREDGTPLELTEELGSGAEGTVYRVSGMPGTAVKVWKKEAQTEEVIRKLRVMIKDTPDLAQVQNHSQPQETEKPLAAWPSEMILDRNRDSIGFTMPLMDPRYCRSVFHYFNPEARTRLRRKITRKDLLVIARNLATATEAIRQAGHVIGDVNEKNVMVSDSLAVTLVDADSMQVRDHKTGEIFRCNKGRDDYTPPRLQGLPFREHDRTPDDDAFGLAVLIFKIAMNGVHPFSSTADPNQERNTTLAEKIRKEYFPYNESGLTPQEHQPSRPYREAWLNAPFSMRHLFRRAFDPDATRNGTRPTPEEWAKELHQIHAVTTEEPIRTLPTEERSTRQRTRTWWRRTQQTTQVTTLAPVPARPVRVTPREVGLGALTFIVVLAGSLSFHAACGPGF